MNKPHRPEPHGNADDPVMDEAYLDAWFARNRDALVESIRVGREEHAAGLTKPLDIEQVIADGMARYHARSK